jgi:hypothetical protein
LVQACRYAGLQRPAIAAYEHARRLEPQIRTAVSHVYMMTGDYEKAIATDHDDPALITILTLSLMGQRDRAIATARRQLGPNLPQLIKQFFEVLLAVFEGRRVDGATAADGLVRKWRLRDPCGTYYLARMLAFLEHPGAMPMLERAVDGGFHCYSFFARDPWLDPLRTEPAFRAVLQRAEAGYRDASTAFVTAGGEALLGPVQPD